MASWRDGVARRDERGVKCDAETWNFKVRKIKIDFGTRHDLLECGYARAWRRRLRFEGGGSREEARSSRRRKRQEGHRAGAKSPPSTWALTITDYRDPESIHAQLLPRGGLEHPPVKLLKWGWMEKRADKLRSATTDEERRALALPRRQDLERDEPDAFYSAEEVRQLETNEPVTGINQLSIVSVSHAWETSVHPDPRGANLLLLVDAIKRAQTTKKDGRRL